MAERTINERLAAGEIIEVGGKLYAACADCGSIVQINKRFFGSLHACLTPEHRAASAGPAGGANSRRSGP